MHLSDRTVFETNSGFTCLVQFGDRTTYRRPAVRRGTTVALLPGFNFLKAFGARFQRANGPATCRSSEPPSQVTTILLTAETIRTPASRKYNASTETSKATTNKISWFVLPCKNLEQVDSKFFLKSIGGGLRFLVTAFAVSYTRWRWSRLKEKLSRN
uniref:Uncharacterized protein n=1 Tax=Glossina palpalis gambiensis TaxID=67801 RepID=A0A1B0BUK2_9MUSC